MRRLISFISIFILVTSHVCAKSDSSHSIVKNINKTITFSTLEAPPYISERLPHGGVILKIISEAYKCEGYTVNYEWFPSKRAEYSASKGLFNGFVGGQITKDREEQFSFGDPIGSLDIVFFHLKDYSFDWETIDDIKGLTVGSTVGVKGYGADFWGAAKKGEFSIEYTYEHIHSIRQLLAGRIDVFPTQKIIGFAIINKFLTENDARKITFHQKPLNSSDYYILFNKENSLNNPKIIKDFNTGLRKLKKSGKYQQWMDEATIPVKEKFGTLLVQP